MEHLIGLLLIIIGGFCLWIKIFCPGVKEIKYHINQHATPEQIEFANIVSNKVGDYFELTHYGVYEYGDLLFGFDSLGYDRLEYNSDVITLANLIVQIRKEKNPDIEWIVKAEYRSQQTAHSFRDLRCVSVKKVKMPKELKKVF